MFWQVTFHNSSGADLVDCTDRYVLFMVAGPSAHGCMVNFVDCRVETLAGQTDIVVLPRVHFLCPCVQSF